jgi:hypothetical protein
MRQAEFGDAQVLLRRLGHPQPAQVRWDAERLEVDAAGISVAVGSLARP